MYDRNDIPADERMAICFARGVALAVFNLLRESCIIKNPDGEILDDLPSKYVVQLLDALLAYKSRADRQKLKGARHCTLWKLKDQISNVVESNGSFKVLWTNREERSSHSLRMTLDKDCTVEWSEFTPISCTGACKLLTLNNYFEV